MTVSLTHKYNNYFPSLITAEKGNDVLNPPVWVNKSFKPAGVSCNGVCSFY